MAARVLVVDDESHITHVVSLKLRNAGYDVVTAADGEEGYEAACAQAPGLIITDLQMPYMTGVEMCAKLRANAATAGIPVILLTARGYALAPDDLARTNIKEMMSKPFSPRDLLMKVVGYIGAPPTTGLAGEAA
jgi:two-component system phosphate regulon response regulator PhoB